MCVSVRVPVCSTHLLICVCLCVTLVCFLLFYFNAVSVLFRWTCWFELHLSTSAAGTHHLDERNRGFFNVRRTFKLHELVIVLWLSFRRLIENWAEHMVWLCERWTNRHGWGGVGRDVWAPFFLLLLNLEWRAIWHLLIKETKIKGWYFHSSEVLRWIQPNICSDSSVPQSSLFYYCNCFIIWWAQSCLMRMSMEIIILTKDRSSPPEKDVGGCVGLLYQFSCTANLILHGLVFTAEHQRLTITRPREPEKESKITLRSWVALVHRRLKPAYPWQH